MIHRAGTHVVNWYLLEEGGKVTIVDAGCTAYRRQLESALREIGRTIDDVEAIVLTHAQSTTSVLPRPCRTSAEPPVYLHEAELTQAERAQMKRGGAALQ